MPDYVYRDRKMMKWMPFNALLEQGDYISDLLHGRERKTMPTLSDDQYAELNYQLETAFCLQQTINVIYYDNHKYKSAKGCITRIDVYNKLIFIDETAVSAETIIEIKD